ncbi:hypothetical protein ACVINI_005863 [Rhizobium beringeri]
MPPGSDALGTAANSAVLNLTAGELILRRHAVAQQFYCQIMLA